MCKYNLVWLIIISSILLLLHVNEIDARHPKSWPPKTLLADQRINEVGSGELISTMEVSVDNSTAHEGDNDFTMASIDDANPSPNDTGEAMRIAGTNDRTHNDAHHPTNKTEDTFPIARINDFIPNNAIPSTNKTDNNDYTPNDGNPSDNKTDEDSPIAGIDDRNHKDAYPSANNTDKDSTPNDGNLPANNHENHTPVDAKPPTNNHDNHTPMTAKPPTNNHDNHTPVAANPSTNNHENHTPVDTNPSTNNHYNHTPMTAKPPTNSNDNHTSVDTNPSTNDNHTPVAAKPPANDNLTPVAAKPPANKTNGDDYSVPTEGYDDYGTQNKAEYGDYMYGYDDLDPVLDKVTRVPLGKFPFIVLVERLVVGETGIFAGSIFTDIFVIVAAACVGSTERERDPSKYTVIAGISNLNSTSMQGGQKRNVTEIILNDSLDARVAILVLDAPLEINKHAKPKRISFERFLGWRACSIIQWGNIHKSSATHWSLLKLEMQVFDNEKCRLKSDSLKDEDLNRSICAFSRGLNNKPVCTGGGTVLLCDNVITGFRRRNKPRCTTVDEITIYTDLGSFAMWTRNYAPKTIYNRLYEPARILLRSMDTTLNNNSNNIDAIVFLSLSSALALFIFT